MKALGSKQLAAISHLFSSAVLKEMARRGRSPMLARFARESSVLDYVPASAQVHDLFETAFRLLKRDGCRDEYVYKAALVQKVLLGRHSLQTASLLTEFRVGERKADLAILNGTSTVYEVKSERDSLVRLTRQVESYSRVFACVNVIAAESHLGAVIGCVPHDVGILCLTGRHRISTIRDAVTRPERTCSSSIFDSIRTSEAQAILRMNGFEIPAGPNTQLSTILRERFVSLPSAVAHASMVTVLKKTRTSLRLKQLISQLPESLHLAALSVPIRKVDHERLVAAVNAPVTDAMAWT